MKKAVSRISFIITAVILIIVAVFGIALYQQFTDLKPDTPIIEPPADEEPAVVPENEPDTYQIMDRFLDLYAQNDDLVGWIRVPNTPIDYPVVYCSDNAFYLKHDFYKKQSVAGNPFLDMGADLIENNQSLSIFAHYMKNGTMFTALHNYKDLDYYKTYPIFRFDSLYEDGVYKIFSVFYMAGNSSDKLFYYYPVSHFSSDDAFMQHVKQLRARSIFDTTVDVAPGDQLVLLTCCTYEVKNLRLIVAGRKVRADESFIVDTEHATLNPNPLYPQKWYDAKGGSPPELP